MLSLFISWCWLRFIAVTRPLYVTCRPCFHHVDSSFLPTCHSSLICPLMIRVISPFFFVSITCDYFLSVSLSFCVLAFVEFDPRTMFSPFESCVSCLLYRPSAALSFVLNLLRCRLVPLIILHSVFFFLWL